MFVNYPEFTYKRAFRFLYTMLNLYRDYKQNNKMIFKPLADDYVIKLYFVAKYNHIRFYYYNNKTNEYGAKINLFKKLREEDKRVFYESVFYHFFKKGVSVPYELIDRDVPLKPLRF